MNWEDISEAVTSVLATHSGLRVLWQNRPQPYIDPSAAAVIKIHVLGVSGWGLEETRYSERPSGSPSKPKIHLVEHIVGPRRIMLRVWCESYRQDPAHAARQYLEKLRSRLRFASVTHTLEGARLALTGVQDLVDCDTGVDARMQSKAYIDLRLAYTVDEFDSENAVDTIEHVELEGFGATGTIPPLE